MVRQFVRHPAPPTLNFVNVDKGVESDPVNIPNSTGIVGAAASTRTIIFSETSGGAIGLGEASYAFPAAVINLNSPQLSLVSQARSAFLLRRHYPLTSFAPCEFTWPPAPILKIWDLLGKHRSPLYHSGQPIR